MAGRTRSEKENPKIVTPATSTRLERKKIATPAEKTSSPAIVKQNQTKSISTPKSTASIEQPTNTPAASANFAKVDATNATPPSTKENESTPSTSAISRSEMDSLIKDLSADIVSKISKEIKDLRSEFIQRFEHIEQNLATYIKKTDKTIESLTERIARMESHHLDVVHELKEDLADLQQRCDRSERKEVASDAVLLGIPQLPNEDIKSILNSICYTVDCVPPSLKTAFRIQRDNNIHDAPIILKFSSPHDRNIVLKSVALFHRTHKRPLHLIDTGISVQGKEAHNVYLHASLTSKNRFYFQQAMRLKHRGAVVKVYTRSGSVYVKESEEGETILINNDTTLKAIYAAAAAATVNQDEEDERRSHQHSTP